MAKDIFHDVFRSSLEEDGWTIMDDPLSIKVGDNQIYIDLSADRFLTADRENQKIAVEIKTFTNGSIVFNFHVAIGQFINYQAVLEQLEPDRKLFFGDSFGYLPNFFSVCIRKNCFG